MESGMEMESESHEKDLTDNLLLKPKTKERNKNVQKIKHLRFWGCCVVFEHIQTIN